MHEIIQAAKDDIDDGLDDQAKTEIELIKHNLKQLEDNITEESNRDNKNKDLKRVKEMINQFKSTIPDIE